MSETDISNLEVLFRYTIPGAVGTLWLFFSLPEEMREALTPSNWALISTAFILLVLITGWALYHIIYPLGRNLLLTSALMKFKIYPKSRVHAALAEKMQGKKMQMLPRDFWSYYLWNHCSTSLRIRVRLLASYGHSLYIVGFAFIFFPIAYTCFRLLFRHLTLFSYLLLQFLTAMKFSSENFSILESSVVILCMLIGILSLRSGRDRIEYAENIQWLAFLEKKKQILKLIEKMQSEYDKSLQGQDITKTPSPNNPGHGTTRICSLSPLGQPRKHNGNHRMVRHNNRR